MIRRCDNNDLELIWDIINDGAQAYKGTIPSARWTETYMTPYVPKQLSETRAWRAITFTFTTTDEPSDADRHLG